MDIKSEAKGKFIPGQRWISDSEPELGLGIILETGFREVKISFRASNVVRVYMHRNAPLRRVRLKAGDRARSNDGKVFLVKTIKEFGGLLVYHGDGFTLKEQDLLDRMTFTDPDKRLLAGQVGKPREFALRYRTHMFRRDMLGSRVRGLVGARMELLEHQISIAHEVASRHNPKVLLADEVGLGKTIEAGMIFHRQFVTGQIGRVLVVAPSQLVHQWLVELYRRFNHMFTVVDEELFRSEEKGDQTVNPFLNRQIMICAVDFLSTSPRRIKQAVESGFDLLIVDEAHHLVWSQTAKSAEYAAVEAVAAVSRGVLLLTATPIQLGQAGHFGRLRLLDSKRFTDLGSYLKEAAQYQNLAGTVDRILSSEAPIPDALDSLLAAFPGDVALQGKLDNYIKGAPGARRALIEDMVDRHGTGRLMFRNRRSALGGFPDRVVHPVPLEKSPEHTEWAKAVTGANPQAGTGPFGGETEFSKFLNGPAAYASTDLKGFEGDASEFLKKAWRKDPRLDWLVGLLKELEGEKILLICSYKGVVFALQEILPTLTSAPFASFHENLTMATRDKNAAYFAQPDGARMLICSEIGSEGRNFQFAHHLVLFDLPLDPSVLEQRIGRLDRIGQKHDIHIHVPFVQGTSHEVLYRWYQEGMDAFRHPVLGSDYFHEEQIGEVMDTCRLAVRAEVAQDDSREAIGPAVNALVERTRILAARVRETLEKGRDRLLEINSNRPELARDLIAQIRAEDEDSGLEEYLEELFDYFGVDTESTEPKRGYFLYPGDRMEVDTFPNLPPTGLAITYDRGEALAREDLAFLTLDHPMVRGAVDLVLSGSEGTVGFVEWREAPIRGFALDSVFVLEATAPGHLHIHRFLAPTPVRVLVDQNGEDVSHLLPRLDASELEQAPTGMIEDHHDQFDKLIPKLLEAAAQKVDFRQAAVKKDAHKEAEKRLGAERDRLRSLMSINPSVTEEDVAVADRLLQETLKHIAAAELRLDAVRLVVMGKMNA
ncbi:MAG: RNA polymerase-associated protein RapA [Fibrobacterota bacterium]|nr:RNA polymerase-associated protein RapA [Fibrobacterota bacterium]